jgi:hypothetical protein
VGKLSRRDFAQIIAVTSASRALLRLDGQLLSIAGRPAFGEAPGNLLRGDWTKDQPQIYSSLVAVSSMANMGPDPAALERTMAAIGYAYAYADASRNGRPDPNQFAKQLQANLDRGITVDAQTLASLPKMLAGDSDPFILDSALLTDSAAADLPVVRLRTSSSPLLVTSTTATGIAPLDGQVNTARRSLTAASEAVLFPDRCCSYGAAVANGFARDSRLSRRVSADAPNSPIETSKRHSR